jgi:hypothetical protein
MDLRPYAAQATVPAADDRRTVARLALLSCGVRGRRGSLTRHACRNESKRRNRYDGELPQHRCHNHGTFSHV